MIKDYARRVLGALHLDLTKNLKYDRLTKLLMAKYLKRNSNCIDVGCHKGEMLNLMLRYAPQGTHYAFEPIPEMFTNLIEEYNKNCRIFPYALAEKDGETTFNYVKNAPAYSGIKKRKYAVAHPDIEEITVQLKRLDEVIPASEKIDFIKIDVEGAELGVLKGGVETIIRNKPFIVFEFGLGASEYYGTKPEDIYTLVTKTFGMQISNLSDFLHNRPPLGFQAFSDTYDHAGEYYFLAH